MTFFRPIIAILSACAPLAVAEVGFNRDIRPIFAKHCTACHGGVKEAGGLSFIFREKVLGEGDSGLRAVVPGDAAASELMRRVRSRDPDEVMPQPKHGPPLSDHEVGLLEQWIAGGAEWQEHWAFVPPAAAGLPAVSRPEWPAVELDHFVLARLDRERLSPAPEAPPAEWLRRTSFDLTGLPPAPDELAAFEAAAAVDAAQAREEVVGRLLGSPAFGEKWAVMWLDLARYSDTYGFEKDPHRDIWPFRDWVIRAFNADMPFDQFTIEQLAGDLLPDPSADQRIATGFHRNTQTNTEGGTDDEEFRVAAVIDRVSTTWTAWQATTFGCVQCHDHPYDPIGHEEFYEFMAFFDQSEDCDLDDDFPKMRVAHDAARRDEASALELEVQAIRAGLNAAGGAAGEAAEGWEMLAFDRFEPSHGTLAAGDTGVIVSTGTLPVGAVHKLSGAAPEEITALRMRILPDSEDPRDWPERGALASKLVLAVIDPDGNRSEVEWREVFADRLEGPHDPMTAIEGKGGGVGSYPKLAGPRWFVFVPRQPVRAAAGSRMEIVIEQRGQTTGNQATPLRRFSLEGSRSTGWSQLVEDPERLAQWERQRAALAALDAIPALRMPVMRERSAEARRETRVFARGNRMNKEQAVEPGLPAILRGPAEGARDRLDMARWLVGDQNPLTARVLANRLWGELFGIGIVETAEDFGTSGTLPSHPELLDHLALRLRDTHRWSVKSMLREIVLSSTYRQSHRGTPELIERDPHNRLLARGPRNRLTAEMVRDQALAVAGLLSPKRYGAPVYPPQPAGVWNSVYSGAAWKESEGEDRYRRGIYTYHKRTSGFPGFITFDAPTRDLCSARRQATNTPLQALVTMNDPAHIEAAQGLARRISAGSGELREQLAQAVLLATQRPASAVMLDELLDLHAAATREYEDHPEEFAPLGESPAAAALVLTANTILNLDSALTR
jgi:hypothetical protein